MLLRSGSARRWLFPGFALFLSGALWAQQAPVQNPAAEPAPPGTQAPAPVERQTPQPAASSPAAGSPAPVAGQTPAGPNPGNTIRVVSRLVVLDFVVVDKKGNVVNDLTRNDFQVQENGEDQTIRNFDAPGRFSPPADVTIDSTADLDRYAPRAPVNIILLDEFNTRFEDMAFARYSLKKWLSKQPDKLNTPTMLVAVSLEKFEVLHDYTQNKDEIISALDHHFAAYPWQAHSGAWVAERMATAFFTLRRVAEATIGHQGHKNMIWIGRGFPNVNWVRFTVDDQSRVNTEVQRTVNELRDARVTLYTIDPAGLMVDPGQYGMDAAIFDPFGGEPNFQKLAAATGGRNLYGRNDVDAEIGTSIRDGSSFYTLTYRPTDTAWNPGKLRKISVMVAGRPDLTVVTRKGYFDARGPARIRPDGQVSRRLVSEIVGAESSTMVYDAVPMTVAISPTPGKFEIHIDPRGLVWSVATDANPVRMTKLILTVTTFDKKGKFLKSDAREIVAKASGEVPPSGRLERALAIAYQLAPNPKAVRARFVVRVDATGRMGTADVDLTQVAQSTPAVAPGAP